MTWTDAKGTFKQWALRFGIVSGVSLVAFIAKTEDSRLRAEDSILHKRIDVVQSEAVQTKVLGARLEEKIDAVRAQLDRIEKKGVR